MISRFKDIEFILTVASIEHSISLSHPFALPVTLQVA